MQRVTIILSLVVAIISLILTGCSTLNTTIDNGIAQIPGQRIQGSVTVLKW